MLRHCSKLVKLSIPTSKLSQKQLGKLIEPMGELQSLDIPIEGIPIHLLLAMCNRLKKLTIRLTPQVQAVLTCDTILTEWAKKEFLPQALNVVSTQKFHFLPQLLQQKWLDLCFSLPTDHIGCFKIYTISKIPMNLFPALPDFQLQFGQSCTLPLVKASEYGLLGLEENYLLLTDFTDGSKALHKATMLSMGRDPMNGDIASLNFVTHFDASGCHLHSGHLEQLAFACPNLLELNLRKNTNCLKSLQGLHVIADHCKKLRGLNLSQISVVEMESIVQLWEILVDMKLTYLAIEVCVLMPHEEDIQTIVVLYQRCLNLRALEFEYSCVECRGVWERCGELFILSNFASLAHIITNISLDYNHLQMRNAMQNIVDSCRMLKYLKYSICTFDSSRVVSSNLEQLYIMSPHTDISNNFMDSLSTHGGLVHIFLRVFRVTSGGVVALIENSPHLLTCQIHTQVFHASSLAVSSNLQDFKMILKKSFSSRKLFSCGCFRLVRLQYRLIETLDFSHTDLNSLWSQPAYRY